MLIPPQCSVKAAAACSFRDFADEASARGSRLGGWACGWLYGGNVDTCRSLLCEHESRVPKQSLGDEVRGGMGSTPGKLRAEKWYIPIDEVSVAQFRSADDLREGQRLKIDIPFQLGFERSRERVSSEATAKPITVFHRMVFLQSAAGKKAKSTHEPALVAVGTEKGIQAPAKFLKGSGAFTKIGQPRRERKPLPPEDEEDDATRSRRRN
ncbi:hypothetical protein B0H11DRAFT_1902830 [Mycena galericulata]|nr:hypothetical protein B0H11DRAFT_1902830 [Mycena galericulata]